MPSGELHPPRYRTVPPARDASGVNGLNTARQRHSVPEQRLRRRRRRALSRCQQTSTSPVGISVQTYAMVWRNHLSLAGFCIPTTVCHTWHRLPHEKTATQFTCSGLRCNTGAAQASSLCGLYSAAVSLAHVLKSRPLTSMGRISWRALSSLRR